MEYEIFGDNIKNIDYGFFYQKIGPVYTKNFNLCTENDKRFFLKSNGNMFVIRYIRNYDYLLTHEIVEVVNNLFKLEENIIDLENNIYFDLTYSLIGLERNLINKPIDESENTSESEFFNYILYTKDKNSSILRVKKDTQNKLLYKNKVKYEIFKPNIVENKNKLIVINKKIYYLILVFEDLEVDNDYINSLEIIYKKNTDLVFSFKGIFDNSDKKKLFLNDINYSIDNIVTNNKNYIKYILNFTNIDFEEFIYAFNYNCVDELYDNLCSVKGKGNSIHIHLNYNYCFGVHFY